MPATSDLGDVESVGLKCVRVAADNKPMNADDERREVRSARPALIGLAGAVLIGALVVVISAVVSTSSARVAATTSSGGLLSAGTIDLTRPDAGATVLLDAEGLYPGAVTRGCTVVRYDGSVPVELRLSARPDGGTGLDDYVELSISVTSGDSCAGAAATTGATATRELFAGLLVDFWRTHSNFTTGVTVDEWMVAGDSVVVVASAGLVDDNRAGGLDTEVTFTFEGRPS